MDAALEPDPGQTRRQIAVAVLVSAAFATGWHLFVGDVHFNAAEEGYLWYGVWRTGLGELPLRDFQSYDPGRYLVCAGLGKLFGSGILGLRRSLAVFQGLGLLFGLLCARRSTRATWPLAPIGVLLGLWLFPRHKVFEGVLSLAATWLGVRLLERPTRARHFQSGLGVGLLAFFGRNHGVYAALGLLVLGAVSAWRRREGGTLRNLLAGSAGVVLGYAPMLVLCLIPGFFAGFLESLRLLARLGTNIAEPWLWPWKVELAGLDAFDAAAQVALAIVYLLPLLVLPIGIVLFLRSRAEELPRRALFLAASVLGAIYVHHAAVRSDSAHLAQAIQPTLLALVGGAGLLRARVSRAARVAGVLVPLVLAAPAVFAATQFNPALWHVGRKELVPVDFAGDTLRLLPQNARYQERLQRTLGGLLAPDDRIFFAPSRAGFYPLFQRRSPSWWIYFFVPEATRAEQERLVEDLADVEWVLIVDVDISEKEELGFRLTHPLVWTFLTTSYQRVPTPELDPSHFLFRRRAAGR